MSRSSPLTVRSPLAVALSRHRLRSAAAAERIVAATGLAPPALILEAGAGDGRLTRAIARRAGRVIAVEIDPTEHARLVSAVADLPHVRPVLGDFLTLPLPRKPYHVIANLPFSLTAETLRRLALGPTPPGTMHLVLDHPAALQWLGLRGWSAAAVLVHVRFEVRASLALRRTDFVPFPRQHPVLVSFCRHEKPPVAPRDWPRFEHFVKGVFHGGGRLGANLVRYAGKGALARLHPGSPDLCIPPGHLPPADWVRLFNRVLRP
jgi:23S rRNA (adenine-N6)-dimethyltransferase